MTSKRQKQEDSATKGVSFRLRDVTICMERTSQPEGVRFTIGRKVAANRKRPFIVAGGQITSEENGTTLHLGWWEGVTVLGMHQLTGRYGSVQLAIAKRTSK